MCGIDIRRNRYPFNTIPVPVPVTDQLGHESSPNKIIFWKSQARLSNLGASLRRYRYQYLSLRKS